MITTRARLLALSSAAMLTMSMAAAAAAQDYPSEDIDILAPGGVGGGWDGTARAMQAALTDGGVVDVNVNVYNNGGAAGTIGLADFVENQTGNAHELMVMGRVMVGGILLNESPVSLDDTTPVASLTTEWEAIAVPTDSPYESLDQLVDDFVADPTSIAWGGGSAGGTDHMVVALIAQEAGVSADQINYIAHAGGGELMPALLSGGVAAGISGLSEFAPSVEAGDLRILAVSSADRLEGSPDIPTIVESSGLDVVISNWRGVMGAGDITEEEQAAIVAMVEAMHATDSWQEALAANQWTDFFQTGAEFETFLEDEKSTVADILAAIGLV
jgi:putative tricarboxylic transport membrane protein